MFPPEPPKRKPSNHVIDVVADGAVNDYREPSFGERPTVPPIPHDAVPRAQAVPRKPTQRGAPAPASEQRPPMSNPPPEDNPPLARPRARQASQRDPDQPPRSSRVDIDTEVLSDADTAKTFRPGIRPWVAIIGVAITAAASVVSTYMLTHATPADCASKGDMNAAQKQLSELTATVNTLATTVGKNADVAHNETSELRNTVNRNADRTEQTLGRLNDKLDLFMKR